MATRRLTRSSAPSESSSSFGVLPRSEPPAVAAQAQEPTPSNTDAYNDGHRFFLQLMMERQILPEEELKQSVARIAEALPHFHLNANLDEFVAAVNPRIQNIFLELRKAISEIDGVSYWGLVNTRSDEAAFEASPFSAQEISFFKEIMKAIIKSKSGEVKRSNCLNLSESRLPKEKRNGCIERLVEDNWLTFLGGNENLGLGIRSYLELRGFFEEETFQDDIVECILCQEMVIRGERCANPNCTTRLHTHCSQRWFADKRARVCPTCTQPWPSGR